MANNYMTVETTNLEGCICYSLQSTTDVQNGAVVGKGELVTGERSVYMALDDYTDGMFHTSACFCCIAPTQPQWLPL